MNKKERYIQQLHHYKITQISTTGRWKTYYKKEDGKLKAVEKTERSDLIEVLYDIYTERSDKSATVGDIYDKILDHKIKCGRILEDSAKNYKTTFHKYFPKLCSMPIKRLDEDRLIEELAAVAIKEKLPERRMKECVEHVHEVCKWAVAHNLISRDISYNIKPKDFYQHCDCRKKEASEKIFSENEIDLVRQDMMRNLNNVRSHMILLSIETGMRLGELCALHVEDVNLKEGYIHIHRQQRRHTGGGKEWYEEMPFTKDERLHPHGGRKFPITKDVYDVLIGIDLHPGQVYLFEENGIWVKKYSVVRFLNRHCKALGLQITNNHAFRMSLNSNKFYAAGLNAKQRSYLLGHSVETNERYYTYTRDEEIDAMRDSLNFAKSFSEEIGFGHTKLELKDARFKPFAPVSCM